MRKIIVIICSMIFLITAVTAGQAVYKVINQPQLDKTKNVNVMLKRPHNWKKIIDSPIIAEDEMTMLDGSTATIPITSELFRQFYNYSDRKINRNRIVLHSTTHNAYINLIDKKCKNRISDENFPSVDLIFVTPPSDEEMQYAQSKQIELDITPIAMDGFVFITNKSNPVDSLTIEQIQDIYTGKITNWKQLGGEDLDIKAYQREKNSGSQTAMEQMVMKGKNMVQPIEIDFDRDLYSTMGGLIDAVAEYENGKASIGYTYYYYINNLYRNDNIKVLKVNGISPENENLLNKSYPFTTSYYAVMRNDEAADSPARKLRDFLLTEKGQQLIEMAGYCRSVK